ncbi:hypothetical protein [Thermocatellispora tengchongensis]|uniref:hypothetical protein n=1 Tax=Thermocatellispora tengchongensis TaxID=1073253 RepID=UPI0036416888
MWGTWLLVTGLIFSLMRGIFHAYYTVALAPAVAALVGMGAAVLWRRRREPAAAVTLAVAAAVTGWWAWVLLGRTPGWNAWLGPVALAAALVLAGAILAARVLPARFLALAGALAVVVSLAGPAAYALDTAASPHTGAIPSAGPAMGGGFGGMRAVGPRDGFGGPRDGRPAGPPQGMGRGGGFGGMGGGGGLLNATTPSAELTALLQRGPRATPGRRPRWAPTTPRATSSPRASR